MIKVRDDRTVCLGNFWSSDYWGWGFFTVALISVESVGVIGECASRIESRIGECYDRERVSV